MPISEHQKEQRKKRLGSSDIAAVMNMSPYANAHDVWLEKTGRLEDWDGNKATEAGNMFEDGVLKWASERLGALVRNQFRVAPDNIPLASNIDAMVAKTQEPVEAKTEGLFNPYCAGGDWGIEGTDQIPDRHILQGHVHMICLGQEICHVPAFLAGIGFQMFQVKRSEAVTQSILEAAGNFWENYVKTDTPPPNITPSGETLKRVIREAEKTAEVDPATIKVWQDVKAEIKHLKTEQKDLERAILTSLGDAEFGEYEGNTIITYKQQTRKEHIVAESTFRVLRYKKPRAGK